MLDKEYMVKFNELELRKILEKHIEWISHGASQNRMRMTNADLRNANLTDANIADAIFNKVDFSRGILRNANLGHAKFDKVYFIHADLDNSNLSHASFSNTILTAATLRNANIEGAFFELANLNHVDMTGACLRIASLINASLYSACIKNANLEEANFQSADLQKADFQNANLEKANFENTDLREATGIILNSTFIRHARFSPVGLRIQAFVKHRFRFSQYENDPWSVLRQIYAGPRVLFHLLFLVAFALPYIGRVAFLSIGSHAEQRAVALVDDLRNRLPADSLTAEQIEGLKQTIADKTEKRHVLALLVHWDKGYGRVAMALLLVFYNAGIFILIQSVGPLRDQEERSGYSPAWDEYRRLRYVHWFVTPVFYLSFGMFLWNIGELLFEPIWVPR